MKKKILFLVSLLLYSCSQTGEYYEDIPVSTVKNRETSSSDAIRIIEINAKKWEYSSKKIYVKEGEKVKIKVINSDVLHGISIPEMQIVDDKEIVLDTSIEGIYEFRCANYCGDGHEEMTGTIIIK